MRFPRIASILRVSSHIQLDFPVIHSLARERLDSIFPPTSKAVPQPDRYEGPPIPAMKYQNVVASQAYSLLLLTPINSSSVQLRKFEYYDIVTSPDIDLEAVAAESPTESPDSTKSPVIGPILPSDL